MTEFRNLDSQTRLVMIHDPCYEIDALRASKVISLLLLGLLSDARTLAPENGGGSLERGSLLRFVVALDRVGHGGHDGATAFLQNDAVQGTRGFVAQFRLLRHNDDAFAVGGGLNSDGLLADEATAGEAVNASQRKRIFGE